MKTLFISLIVFLLEASCVTTDPVHMIELRSGELVSKRIPDRPAHGLSGAAFIEKIRPLDTNGREATILAELTSGNMPDFLRHLRPVKLFFQPPGKPKIEAVIWVMPDYLAIGRDDNYVRVPMNPVTAQKIADRFGCILPTTKIVDAIYSQADIRLTPKPMKAGPSMVSTDYFWQHNLTIEGQLGSTTRGKLVAGHKKDVVLTNKLIVQPTRVAIYGWHQSAGNPIQPLSLVHGYRYADYSHGIRLVSNYMQIDGKPALAQDVLKDPVLSGLLSEEGTLNAPRIRTELLSQADSPHDHM